MEIYIKVIETKGVNRMLGKQMYIWKKGGSSSTGTKDGGTSSTGTRGGGTGKTSTRGGGTSSTGAKGAK